MIEPGAAPSRASFVLGLRQDLRYAVRVMRRAPGGTAAAIVALALGIGATVATFSVVDAVLIRPLAYASPDRLVVVLQRRANPVSPANFLDWQRQAQSFASLGAAEFWTPNLGTTAGREKIDALRMTPELLPLLGVAPAMGRLLRQGDDALQEMVIAHGLWQRQFAADPDIVGRRVLLDGRTFTIVGVMPASFRFAPFWATRAEIWAPLPLADRATERRGNSLRVFARLKDDVSIDAAQAEMTAIAASLERAYPGTSPDVEVTPLKEMVVGDVRQPLVVLFAAVALVLVIACANVAHMLLARAASREREIGIRIALGAGRARLLRQLLTESLLLSSIGGALGVALAHQALQVLIVIAGRSVPRIESAGLDWRVIACSAGLSVLTGIVFGLAPAVRSLTPSLVASLRDAERGSSAGRRAQRLRHVLVASELAMAMTLLVGAGLLLRSFVALRTVDPGFEPDRVLSMVVSVAGSAESPAGRRTAFYQQTLARLRATPGIEAASFINHLPLAGDIWGFPFHPEGRPLPPPGQEETAAYRVVMPGYFQTMRLPLVRGRDVSERDTLASPGVIIVNQLIAAKYWPGEDAIGKRMRVGSLAGGDWLTVVGVAKNAVRGDWSAPPGEEIYLPYHQSRRHQENAGPASAYMTLVVRTAGDPLAMAATVRAMIRARAPDVTTSEVLAMLDVVRQATAGARFLIALLGAFAGIAIVLAAVGVYGVMSYMVAGRRHEIGIRMALGATPRHVLVRVVGQGMIVAGAGLLAGIVATLALSGFLTDMLYGVPATDPATFFTVAIVLAAVALVACYVPARRASRIDPLSEIR